MAWNDYGCGAGIYRSTGEASTVWLTSVPDILEELRVGVNERIAITDLAYIAAFETGEGLTFAQAVAAVAALRAKIESFFASYDDWLLNWVWVAKVWPVVNIATAPWPPADLYVTLSDLLSEGSYGSAWLTFERIQDGRVYEQIREAIDNIKAVGVAVRNIAQAKWKYAGVDDSGAPGPSYWPLVYAAAAPVSYVNYSSVSSWVATSIVHFHEYDNECARLDAIRVPLSAFRVIPEAWAGRISWDGGQESDYAYQPSITLGGITFIPAGQQDEWFTLAAPGASDGTYFTLAVSSSLSAVYPWSTYHYLSQWFFGGSEAWSSGAGRLSVYDIGSTWTKKP